MLYSLPQIYFSYYALNTGQTLYVAIFQSTFNLLYTSLPPLVAGWYEKDLPDDLVLAYPESFQAFKDETIFDFQHFARWLLVSFYQGTVLYLFIHFAVMGSFDASGDVMQDGKDVYLWLFGTEILFAVILLSNLKMTTSLEYITSFNVGAALIGIALFILALVIFALEYVISFSARLVPAAAAPLLHQPHVGVPGPGPGRMLPADAVQPRTPQPVLPHHRAEAEGGGLERGGGAQVRLQHVKCEDRGGGGGGRAVE